MGAESLPSRPFLRALVFACLCGAAALAGAPPAPAAPYIHAHRGGAIVKGKPTYPENTMPAFRQAARRGFTLELDAKITADGVPVVFHDATLDRVTPCTGLLADRTFAQLRGCKLDVLGAEDHLRQLAPSDPRRAPIPRLQHRPPPAAPDRRLGEHRDQEHPHRSGLRRNLQLRNHGHRCDQAQRCSVRSTHHSELLATEPDRGPAAAVGHRHIPAYAGGQPIRHQPGPRRGQSVGLSAMAGLAGLRFRRPTPPGCRSSPTRSISRPT